MAKQIVLSEDVKHLIIHGIPDGLVSPSGNRYLALVQQLVDAVNELSKAATPTTTAAPTTTTAAPTTTLAV